MPGANVQKGKHLETPLHAAAQHSSTEIVNLLLEFGADINAKNTDFERPVDLAAPRSLVERLLLLHEGKLYVCYCKCIFVNNHATKKPPTTEYVYFQPSSFLSIKVSSNIYSQATASAQPSSIRIYSSWKNIFLCLLGVKLQ